MALRQCLTAVALAACVATGCKDKEAAPKAATATDLDRRCEQLAMACGDKDKHTDKILDACKAAAAKQVKKSCTAQAVAAYDCYEKELCGKSDKVWALEDLGVLAKRHEKCIAERDALRECVDKK